MVRVKKNFAFVLSALALGLFYQSCGDDVARLATSKNNGSDAARKSLQEMAARTPDSQEDRAFMALLSDSVANTITNHGADSCGCPGTAGAAANGAALSEKSDNALALDGSTTEDAKKVGTTCDRVGRLANRFLPNDGGCWLRANAVCIGGITCSVHGYRYFS